MTSMSGVVQLAFMKSFAVWDDIEIYTDTIGLTVTLQLAQIEVDDFYSCNDMFHHTSVIIHVVGWERELTTFSLKEKRILLLLLFCLFLFIRFLLFVCLFVFLCLFVKTDKKAVEPLQPLVLANTLVMLKYLRTKQMYKSFMLL